MQKQDAFLPDLVVLPERDLGRLVEVTDGGSVRGVAVDAGEEVVRRALEFFLGELRNENTCAIYGRAVAAFLAWCDGRGLSLHQVEPLHVADYVEVLPGEALAPATIKQHLVAMGRFWKYLLTDGSVKAAPMAPVKGPRIRRGEGKPPRFSKRTPRLIMKTLETDPVRGLRDRALLSRLETSLASMAVVKVQVRDFQELPSRAHYRLQETGGREKLIEAYPETERYVRDYVEVGELLQGAHGDDGRRPQTQGAHGQLLGRDDTGLHVDVAEGSPAAGGRADSGGHVGFALQRAGDGETGATWG